MENTSKGKTLQITKLPAYIQLKRQLRLEIRQGTRPLDVNEATRIYKRRLQLAPPEKYTSAEQMTVATELREYIINKYRNRQQQPSSEILQRLLEAKLQHPMANARQTVEALDPAEVRQARCVLMVYGFYAQPLQQHMKRFQNMDWHDIVPYLRQLICQSYTGPATRLERLDLERLAHFNKGMALLMAHLELKDYFCKDGFYVPYTATPATVDAVLRKYRAFLRRVFTADATLARLAKHYVLHVMGKED